MFFSLSRELWHRTSFEAVGEKDRTRLHHVLRTWNERHLFVEHIEALNAVVRPSGALRESIDSRFLLLLLSRSFPVRFGRLMVF